MDRATALFWSLIVLLTGASLFFGIHAEQQRRSVQRGGGSIDNGDLVRLVRVIDGDSLLETPGKPALPKQPIAPKHGKPNSDR